METVVIQKNKIPDGWEIKKLSDITEIIMGQSPPSKAYNSQKIGLPFFQGKAEFGELYPIPRKWCDKPKKIAENNDVLMSVRAPVGPVNLAKTKCCVGRGLCAIRAKSDVAHYKYVYNFLKLQEEVLAQKGQGSTFTAISKKDVYEIPIPIPFPREPKKSLEIQEKIVAKLDAFFEHYNKLKEEKQKSKERYNKVFKNLIESLIPVKKLPKDWKMRKLGSMATHISSGSTPRGGKKNYLKSGKIYFIRSQNIHNNKLAFSNISYIPEEIHDDMKRSWVEYGDVLLNITGASIGRVAYYELKDSIANVNQHVCIIRTKKDELSPQYLTFLLISDYAQNLIMGSQQGVTREALNYTQIKNMEIPVPATLEEQKLISSRLQIIFSKIEKIGDEQRTINFQLKQLPKSILSKAFRGELL